MEAAVEVELVVEAMVVTEVEVVVEATGRGGGGCCWCSGGLRHLDKGVAGLVEGAHPVVVLSRHGRPNVCAAD